MHTIVPTISAYMVTIMVPLFLEILNLSIILDTMASIIDTEDVSAANETITKNKSPIKFPIFPIEPNTLGRDTNISPGPPDIPSFPINTYTAGTIISPARNATAVSNISI